MSPAKKNNQPARIPRGRILLIAWCLIGAAWTCRGVLAGHRGDNPAACVALRDRICEAVAALKKSGPNGHVAVQTIHQDTHR